MLKKNLSGATMTIVALVAALVGFILRGIQMDGGSATGLIVVSILFCLAFVALSMTLKRRRKYTDVFTRCSADLLLTTLGAVLIIAGCGVALVAGVLPEKLIAVLGILSALALLRALMLRSKKQEVPVLYYVPMVVYYVVRLFFDFRQWTLDPAILDYCFMLFASICFMVSSYLAGAFCFDRGGRRLLSVFAIMGVYFGGISLRYSDAQTVLTYLGGLTLMLSYVWQTSKPKLKRRGQKE